MSSSESTRDADVPICPKCSGNGKHVGAHERMNYFRCLACSRIWAQPRD